MHLGIDFGTNRTVVAAADRGNYPLISFEAPDGSTADWFPSLLAVRGEERRYGWAAWDLQGDPAWTVVRSVKRLLEQAGPLTLLDLGDQQVPLQELVLGFARALATGVREQSNIRLRPQESLQAVIGVPAHANTNQRFLTVEAFRSAGFEVLGVLNEPSAASIEFGHAQRQGKASRETILVYDLGGGTFDASLVTLDENVHHVVASEGIPTIGGDDFDQILADQALTAAGVSDTDRNRLCAASWFRLLEECRRKKESLNPNSRRIVVDLEHAHSDWGVAQVSVAEFYEAARPLVEETLDTAEELLNKAPDASFEALYVTGGGSELPLVSRVLRERFGRRVRRSAYTRSATAIGLAIQADQPETYRLSERLARHFGVWREADRGARIIFDPLFERGIHLPSPGEDPLVIERSYSPVHNVGHFRFLECSHRSPAGTPTGEITFWDDIRFPFDPPLVNQSNLASAPVRYSDGAARQRITEKYICDSSGCISITMSNDTAHYSRTYKLGHWSRQETKIKPMAKRVRA